MATITPHSPDGSGQSYTIVRPDGLPPDYKSGSTIWQVASALRRAGAGEVTITRLVD